MSSVAEVVARLSGVVSYSDGSKGQFAAHLDRHGNVSYNGQVPILGAQVNSGYTDSRQTMADTTAVEGLAPQTPVEGALTKLLGAIPVTHRPTYVAGVSASTTKVVTAVEAEFSGRVSVPSPALGHPSWEDFIYQYSSLSNNPGASTPSGGTDGTIVHGTAVDGNTSAWKKARYTTALRAALHSMFPDVTIV